MRQEFEDLHLYMMFMSLAGVLLTSFLCFVDENDKGTLNAIPLLKDDVFSSTGISSNDELSKNYSPPLSCTEVTTNSNLAPIKT